MTYIPPKSLSIRGLVAIHKDLQARYGRHSTEVNEGKLELALARAATFCDDGKKNLRARLAAAYAWAILKNRPFAEGNEMMALAALVTSCRCATYSGTAPRWKKR